MSAPPSAVPVEEQIAQWRGYLRQRRAINGADVEELEGHLRDQIAMLTTAGLAGDEAFLVAVKRMGSLDSLSREFAREHSERLWKQLVVADDESPDAAVPFLRRETIVVLGLAVAAALAVKAPELFGVHLLDSNGKLLPFYQRNAGFFVTPMLVLYFAWKRGMSAAAAAALAIPFAIAAVFANVYPFAARSSTQNLTSLHLPIALWFIVGGAYAGRRWLTGDGRMNFVRFSGELFIYYVLIALGGAVLTGFTVMMFDAIGVRVDEFVGSWLVPCGAAGAVIIASWLVEAKQSVIENMAPVLTRVFTPLFTIILLVFLGAMAWTGHAIDIKREVLISFDLLLVLVVGLVLYAVSAREPQARPDLFDVLQLLLVTSALAVDVLALAAIGGRISEFGFTPNRVAALGENIILLVNLLGAGWLYLRFVRSRVPFAALERWQTGYLPVYSAWAVVVVIVFPPLFKFI
ncbi:MAG TPA: permease prefix domain 1-containing protein [Vicinamibacterales bacterium]|jgi:hypothetical protein|nr:permease prefix domain 1-containing protein [Vicinamibacterales bacterium]